MVVRISKGKFDLKDVATAERLLAASEGALRDALTRLPGLVHYYVGIDRVRGYLTNVSVWDSPEHAHQMDTLPAMLAQRPILEAAGVGSNPPRRGLSLRDRVPVDTLRDRVDT